MYVLLVHENLTKYLVTHMASAALSEFKWHLEAIGVSSDLKTLRVISYVETRTEKNCERF